VHVIGLTKIKIVKVLAHNFLNPFLQLFFHIAWHYKKNCGTSFLVNFKSNQVSENVFGDFLLGAQCPRRWLCRNAAMTTALAIPTLLPSLAEPWLFG
jgi:hypothetical protein